MTKYDNIIQCFENNWDVIHDDWTEGLRSNNLIFMKRTNNRLESLNQRIKKVCPRNANDANVIISTDDGEKMH